LTNEAWLLLESAKALLPSRNTSAGRPVVPGTAQPPLSFLPSSEKETICDVIFLPLMVPLFMVMQQILLQGSLQRRLSNQDELCQAFLFD
jgi:hypothetical protein